MASKAIQFTSPVGRFVWGSMYKPRTTDAEGKPLVAKSGPNIGQPREDFAFGVAIPKGPERHWSETEWGKNIWQAGHAGFPQGQANAPTFAWKVIDGDSQVPNRKGTKPCDRQGYPGHWVLSYSSSYPPRLYNANGTKPLMLPTELPHGQAAPITAEVAEVKCGYYVQVAGNVDANGSPNQPGVYLNHSMVALSGYGPEIVQGPDASSVGFGQSPLPAGASTAPVGGVPQAYAPAPPVYAPPPAPVPVPTAYAPAPMPSYAPPTPNPPPVPHYPILGAGAPVPPAVPAPPPPPVPPAVPAPPPPVPVPVPVPVPAPQRVMLPAAGWNDDMLRSNGMMA